MLIFPHDVKATVFFLRRRLGVLVVGEPGIIRKGRFVATDTGSAVFKSCNAVRTVVSLVLLSLASGGGRRDTASRGSDISNME